MIRKEICTVLPTKPGAPTEDGLVIVRRDEGAISTNEVPDP